MINRKSSFLVILVLLYPVVMLHATEFLGTSGNVKGKVVDVTTNEALPGVNILIVGSGRGGVTNEKGEYFITGVTPGSYILRVSSLGYQTIESKKTDVDADETVVLNFKLASEDIQMEGVTVEGQAPLVDITKTAGDQTFNRDKIEQLPNVKGVEDVLRVQAGVVQFGGQMFLRGGRANETQIMIDGVAVNDVGAGGAASGSSSTNEQLQQIYSGNSTAGTGGALSVSANAIQSVSVSSSGLDAEFGNAQSGVVNITTKTGGDSYSGSVQYRTDEPTGQSQNERFFAANLGGPEPITRYLLPALGVDVPGRLSFFMSGNFTQSDGPFNFTEDNSFYNPTRRKIKFGGFLGRLLKGLGLEYSDRQDNDFSFNTKFSYQIGESDNFSYSYRVNTNSSRPLSGSYSWRDRSDSTTSNISLVDQNVVQWTHILGTNSLLKGYVSRLETDRTSAIGDLVPYQYTYLADLGSRDPSSDGFFDLGANQGWSTSNTVIWNTKFDFNAQIHPLHFLKTGVEFFYEEIQSTSITRPAERPEVDSLSHRGAFPGAGLARWVTAVYPSRGALYAQDNIEFTSINIHLGMRYDFFYLGKQVFGDEWVKRWEYVTEEKATWLENESFFDQFKNGYFSPRLSIGYPISTTTVFYFNYGHFLQYPERDQLYHDPIPSNTLDVFVGNPSLKPQKTIQYEAGFDQLIFEDFSLGIRGFYKDIFDYVTLSTQAGSSVQRYVNLDYASARGFEIILNKQLRNRYSGSLGYTFQLAKGRSSNPFAILSSGALASLPREVRLDFDQQHTLNLFLAYRVAKGEDFDILGLPFDNWGASVTWNFGSGFPYTPYDPRIRRGDLAEAYLKNTGNGPYTAEVNVSFFKGVTLFEKLSLLFSIDITNLLNRKNVDLNAGGFNTLFGRPLTYGDYSNIERIIYPWGAASGSQSFESRVPPFVFRAPRQIAFGLKINWD